MDKSNQLFSLMYNGPLFILAIFWILFRIHEYRRVVLGMTSGIVWVTLHRVNANRVAEPAGNIRASRAQRR